MPRQIKKYVIGDKGESSFIRYCNKHNIGWIRCIKKSSRKSLYIDPGLLNILEALHFEKDKEIKTYWKKHVKKDKRVKGAFKALGNKGKNFLKKIVEQHRKKFRGYSWAGMPDFFCWDFKKPKKQWFCEAKSISQIGKSAGLSKQQIKKVLELHENGYKTKLYIFLKEKKTPKRFLIDLSVQKPHNHYF